MSILEPELFLGISADISQKRATEEQTKKGRDYPISLRWPKAHGWVGSPKRSHGTPSFLYQTSGVKPNLYAVELELQIHGPKCPEARALDPLS